MKLKKMMAILLSITLIMSNSSMVVLAETAGNDQVNAVTEEVVEEIVVDETKTISIVANKVTVLKFVPEVKGTYAFSSSSNSERDTYGLLMDSNMEEICSELGDGGVFYISYDMEAGATYYLGARYNNENAEGSFEVKVTCVEVYCDHSNAIESIPATEAKCNAFGYTEGEKCKECGKWISGHERTEEIFHTDESANGLCDHCGEEMPVSRGTCGGILVSDEDAELGQDYDGSAKYYKYADGTVEIYGEGRVATIVIGEGNPFSNDATIKKVIVREGITGIGTEMFYDCEGLEEVTLPETVVGIDEDAFYSCNKLRNITILNPECEIYDQSGTIYYGAAIIGHEGSTAEAYAQEYGREFLEYCPHENTTEQSAVEATCYSDGYTAGEKCNACGRWASGHERVDALTHTDENSDSRCDYCSKTMPVKSGICGGYWYYGDEGEQYIPTAYYYKYADGTLEIYGEGTIGIGGEYSDSDERIFEGDSTIKKVIIMDGITSITSSCFADCEYLTKVKLPETLQKIGERAFYECYKLEAVTIPESVTEIGEDAFYYCYSLALFCFKDSTAEEIFKEQERAYVLIDGTDEENTISGTRGDTLTWALNKKTGKLILTVDEIMPSFANVAAPWDDYDNFVTSVEIRGTCKNIGKRAFSGCRNLVDIIIPEEVTEIGEWAFDDCRSLKELVIPEGVKTIEKYAFHMCSSLTKVNIPDGITAITDEMFYGCESMTNIEIPDSVTSIGFGAFWGCPGLENLTIPDSVTSIGFGAFRYTTFEEITIPYQVAKIEDSAFRYNENLSKITILNKNCSLPSNLELENPNVAIYGFKGSTAEAYALENGYSFKSLDAGHVHSWKQTHVKATSSNDGYKKSVCTGCGEVESKTIYQISNVSLGKTKYAYTGKVISPTVTVKDSKGAVLTKDKDYTVSGLTGKKSVGRYKVTVTFKGDYEGTKDLYFTIVPKKSSSAKAELYGYDDVKFSWSKVTGASGYLVYYKKGSGKWSKAVATTKTYYKKANLSDGVKYTFKVVPYYKTKTSTTKYYDANQYKSTTIYTLKKVAGVKVAKSGSKVKVSWTNISGETGYQISKMTKKSATQKTPTTVKSSSAKSKLLAATKGKTYYYKVRAYKTVNGKKIYGPWSTVKAYKRK